MPFWASVMACHRRHSKKGMREWSDLPNLILLNQLPVAWRAYDFLQMHIAQGSTYASVSIFDERTSILKCTPSSVLNKTWFGNSWRDGSENGRTSSRNAAMNRYWRELPCLAVKSHKRLWRQYFFESTDMKMSKFHHAKSVSKFGRSCKKTGYRRPLLDTLTSPIDRVLDRATSKALGRFPRCIPAVPPPPPHTPPQCNFIGKKPRRGCPWL